MRGEMLRKQIHQISEQDHFPSDLDFHVSLKIPIYIAIILTRKNLELFPLYHFSRLTTQSLFSSFSFERVSSFGP